MRPGELIVCVPKSEFGNEIAALHFVSLAMTILGERKFFLEITSNQMRIENG